MFSANGYYYDSDHDEDLGEAVTDKRRPVGIPVEVVVTGSRTSTAISPPPSVPIHLAGTTNVAAKPSRPDRGTRFSPVSSRPRLTRPRQCPTPTPCIEESHNARTSSTRPPHIVPSKSEPTPTPCIDKSHNAPTRSTRPPHIIPSKSEPTKPLPIYISQTQSAAAVQLAKGSLPLQSEPIRQLPEHFTSASFGPEYPVRNPTSKEYPLSRTHLGTNFMPGERSTMAYPRGDFRNSSGEAIRDIQSTIMVKWLRQTQLEKAWASTLPGEGVVLKNGRDSFTSCPESLKDGRFEFYRQVAAMNVRCAMTVSTDVIAVFLSQHSVDYVPLTHDRRLQVLPSMSFLCGCKKHHFGAFIKDEQRLVVWDDDPKALIQRADHIVNSLVQTIWEQSDIETDKSRPKRRIAGAKQHTTVTVEELELGLAADKRPTLLINSIMVAMTLTLLIAALGFGWRNLAQEVFVDYNYVRLAILAVTPCQIFVSLFFMQTIIVNIGQMIGPINQLKINSKFYSGIPPPRLSRNLKILPHMTIQMPVYKEGLHAVIQPTVRSLKAALSTYELQGGTGNIFVNDDGMQLLPEDEAQARRDFYDENNIGWVARPKHNPKPQEGETQFIRGGKFKKASNMNFALTISNKVEEALLLIERDANWTQEMERVAYQLCLTKVLAEDKRAWAAGDIRVGDYILLIDSDTRVPHDCLLDAASEMELSPQVGILQYSSGVMTVTDSFFEKGVTFFTDLIYTAIRYTVANGDVAPFVGHNAVLRWSALQHVAQQDEDGIDKFWSESHVSEDFDMSLRLQIEGYTVRLASYQGDEFKEGVSLTVYDELSRWEKYAYGCNELLFNPFRLWITRSPFTPLFRKFICSNIRLTSKITILAYIGTYYAIAASWLLTLTNYFIIGWFNGYLDHYYIDSFKVYFSLIVVFSVMGNFALAMLRYRLAEKELFSAVVENFKWLLLLTIFLGGSSLHVSQAILCHFFEINMTWGATAKEAEAVSFFEEIPRLLKRFKFTFLFCIACAGMVAAGVLLLPWPWQITDFVAIFPLMALVVNHFFLPVALNPALMQFTW